MTFNSKPVQLVRHMHEVMSGYNKAVAAGSKFMVQTKFDGVFGFAIWRDRWELYSRTGKQLTNVGNILSGMTAGADRGYVYLMEIVEPTLSLEQLSACIGPNRKKPIEHAFTPTGKVHDLIPLEHFLDGESPLSADTRYKLLRAKLYEKPIQWVTLISTVFDKSLDEINLIAEALIAHGKEGIVIKQQDAGWKAGRKTHHSMKKVRGCDYDLRAIRVEAGKGKRANMAANVICEWRLFGDPDNPIIEIPVDLGMGFGDARRVELLLNPEQVEGKIVEVHALQIGSKGALRLPKVNSIRVDKTESDV